METSDIIIEGLYLGGVLAALNEKDLLAKKITHILSLDDKPLPDTLTHKLTYKHVFALDMEDFDLISCFAECIGFIDQAIEGHCSILVHCQAGMSRSATAVVAYLMCKQQFSKEKALQHVASCRPQIRPNYGFMEQLNLFEIMGGQMNRSHPEYRAYKLNKVAMGFKSGKYSQGVSDEDVPADLFVQPDYSGKGGASYYKCRKCRVFLFHEGAITQHSTGQGDAAFDWRSKIPANKRPPGEGSGEGLCTMSLFVSPMVWMKGKINSMVGKLHCPKCNAKIGSYVWYGEKCPCGSWVAPAFHIDAGKVDKIPSQPVVPRSHTPVRPFASSAPLRDFTSVAPSRPHGQVEGFPQYHAGPSRPISQLSEATTAEVASRLASARIPSSQATAIATVSPMPVAHVTPMATATVAPMESDTAFGAVGGTVAGSSRGTEQDREIASGISSMHMDVDS